MPFVGSKLLQHYCTRKQSLMFILYSYKSRQGGWCNNELSDCTCYRRHSMVLHSTLKIVHSIKCHLMSWVQCKTLLCMCMWIRKIVQPCIDLTKPNWVTFLNVNLVNVRRLQTDIYKNKTPTSISYWNLTIIYYIEVYKA